mmetsp:Transcript_27644/g.63361  ORF Transcript_27644/g.63361 Transcript_27644/m.63361 type:complete len:599 (-) Transcript_27644:169-1965(-)
MSCASEVRKPQRVRLVRHLVKVNLLNISGISSLLDFDSSEKWKMLQHNESKLSAIVSISNNSSVVTSVPSRPLSIVSVDNAPSKEKTPRRDPLKELDMQGACKMNVPMSVADFVKGSFGSDSYETPDYTVRYLHEASWIWQSNSNEIGAVDMVESDGSSVVLKVYLREILHPRSDVDISQYEPGSYGFEPKFLYFTIGLVNESHEVIVLGSSKIVVDGKSSGVTMKLPVKPVNIDEYAHANSLKNGNGRGRRRCKEKGKRNTRNWDMFSLVQSSSWFSNRSAGGDRELTTIRRLSDGTIWRSFRNDTIQGRMFGISSGLQVENKSDTENDQAHFQQIITHLKKSYHNAALLLEKYTNRSLNNTTDAKTNSALTIKLVVTVPLRKKKPIVKISSVAITDELEDSIFQLDKVVGSIKDHTVRRQRLLPKTKPATKSNKNGSKAKIEVNPNNDDNDSHHSDQIDRIGHILQLQPEKPCDGSITSSGSSDCNFDDDISSCISSKNSVSGAEKNIDSKLLSNLYIGMEESVVHRSKDSISDYSLTDDSISDEDSVCSNSSGSFQYRDKFEKTYFDDWTTVSSYEMESKGSKMLFSQVVCLGRG